MDEVNIQHISEFEDLDSQPNPEDLHSLHAIEQVVSKRVKKTRWTTPVLLVVLSIVNYTVAHVFGKCFGLSKFVESAIYTLVSVLTLSLAWLFLFKND